MTSNPEMVERVARAICVSEGLEPEGYFMGQPLPLWENYIEHAKAAIEVMREPTKKDA